MSTLQIIAICIVICAGAAVGWLVAEAWTHRRYRKRQEKRMAELAEYWTERQAQEDRRRNG